MCGASSARPKNCMKENDAKDDPHGRVLPPFDELIESGKVVGLNFPVALNPALAKVIGTMMKIDYQRAVQLRIPKMDAEPERHFRPTVFICDEYQNYATVGGDNPTGDERFLSISRQPKCIPIVATQSISSLKEALPNEGVKTLLAGLPHEGLPVHLRPRHGALRFRDLWQDGPHPDQLHRF